MQFSDLPLHKNILKAVAELRFHSPTVVQQKAIPVIIAKKDVIVAAQTGTGKTAAFALPVINQLIETQDAEKGEKKIKALIISPTRELAHQINENFKAFCKYTNLRTTVVYGGVSLEPQKDVLKKGVDILIATPGRLLDLHRQGEIDLRLLKTLVIDEADLMLDMGFINDVQHIEELCPRKKQTLLFSATMPDKIVALASKILQNPEKLSVASTETKAKEIGQLLYYVPKRNKTDLCLQLLRTEINGKVIIFRRTKFGVDKLEQTLQKNRYQVTSLHGDKSQNLRNKAIEDFKNNKANILIATDVAARGIDISKVDVVINFDLPNIAETYVHRIGRTGRAGKSGLAISLCSVDEVAYVKIIQAFIGKDLKVIEDHPFPVKKTKPKKQPNTINPNKKSRKSKNSKKNKKRWY